MPLAIACPIEQKSQLRGRGIEHADLAILKRTKLPVGSEAIHEMQIGPHMQGLDDGIEREGMTDRAEDTVTVTRVEGELCLIHLEAAHP